MNVVNVCNKSGTGLSFARILLTAIRKMIRFFDLKKLNAAHQPALGEAVQRIADSGSYIRGSEVFAFENKYASYSGVKYCTGVGNGFDALKLIFRSWIISGVLKEGDEVIVPANTYIASILAVTENKLKPVFVEPDIATYNINPSGVLEKITNRTRAIMLVHLYGRNCFSEVIRQLAEEHGLKIIEDNAQAAGCAYVGRRTGSLGHAAAHSFFPTKNLGALGDGGAVTTDDEVLAEIVRTLGNYGSRKKGINDIRGVNSRLDELQAAVLNVKLRRLDEENAMRRNIASFYLNNIKHPEIILPAATLYPEEHVWHLFVVRCERRDALQKFLADKGIESMVHYPVPPHRQPAFADLKDLRYPVSEKIHREVLSLPLNPVLAAIEMQQVAEAVGVFK